jgi:hypothetical protein
VPGIELNEINKMESEFVTGIDFNLYVGQGDVYMSVELASWRAL